MFVGRSRGAGALFVARRFRVEEDPRIDEVERMLPGANCGGCGFAGCRGLADALVGRDDIAGLYCPVGGAECMKRVAAYLGKCRRPRSRRADGDGALRRHVCKTSAYEPVLTACVRAPWLRRSMRARRRAPTVVWGYGDCVEVCAFDALRIDPETGFPWWTPSAARRAAPA